ncbi:MAG: DUF4492 domain-containing protein [Bacteroidales bacterium]|nr:DUF4492 domain-containing protein [Bacteroidales bacterium]
MIRRMNILSRVFYFYRDGFKNMSKWGKQLWMIILIKLFIMFFVLKLFFFPNLLKKDFKTDEDRANFVIEQLTNQELKN